MNTPSQHASSAWLSALQMRLEEDFALQPVLATEIEFYLLGSDALPGLDALLAQINEAVAAAGIVAQPIEKERAIEQYEIALLPMNDVVLLAEKTESLKQIIRDIAARANVQAEFAAKPFADRAGSGLHLHVHLENADGVNQFTRAVDDRYSDTLLHSIQGLLALMPASMPFFAPQPESYARFVPGGTAPTHCCWGPNNRTVALRLPRKPMDRKHIEHRVSGADADVALALGAVLMGVHYGLSLAQLPPEPIHGEAWHEQYELSLLPNTWETAQALFEQSAIVHGYL